jgi:hypothetical protein
MGSTLESVKICNMTFMTFMIKVIFNYSSFNISLDDTFDLFRQIRKAHFN